MGPVPPYMLTSHVEYLVKGEPLGSDHLPCLSMRHEHVLNKQMRTNEMYTEHKKREPPIYGDQTDPHLN